MPTLAGMKSFVQSVSFDDGSGSDKGMNELICKMEEQHQLSLRQVVPILRRQGRVAKPSPDYASQ
jgi:hypothetical protein